MPGNNPIAKAVNLGPFEQLDFLPSPVAALFGRKSQWAVPNPHCQRLLKAANTKASAANPKEKEKGKEKEKDAKKKEKQESAKAKAKTNPEKNAKTKWKARQPTEYGETRADFIEKLLGQIIQLIGTLCFSTPAMHVLS